MFSDCLALLADLLLTIVDFMSSIDLIAGFSLLDFSIGLSFMALAIAIIRGVFGGSDNR